MEKKLAKAVENKVAEVKATEKKVVFNKEEFAQAIVSAFKDNEFVTCVADTDLSNPRDTSCAEFEYIHFFRKGTEKDLFKMYNKNGKTRFAVSSILPVVAGEGYDVRPVMNTKTQKIKWINVFTAHENAIDVANILIAAYNDMPKPEKKEKAVKKEADTKTKATQKKPVKKEAK